MVSDAGALETAPDVACDERLRDPYFSSSHIALLLVMVPMHSLGHRKLEVPGQSQGVRLAVVMWR